MEKPKPLVIAIKPDVKKGLDELKILPRETYSQVIERLIVTAKECDFQVKSTKVIMDTIDQEAELSEELKGVEEVNKIIQDSEKPVDIGEQVPEKISPEISMGVDIANGKDRTVYPQS